MQNKPMIAAPLELGLAAEIERLKGVIKDEVSELVETDYVPLKEAKKSIPVSNFQSKNTVHEHLKPIKTITLTDNGKLVEMRSVLTELIHRMNQLVADHKKPYTFGFNFDRGQHKLKVGTVELKNYYTLKLVMLDASDVNNKKLVDMHTLTYAIKAKDTKASIEMKAYKDMLFYLISGSVANLTSQYLAM